ncbi:MAG: TlpA family protein disulfide reductase [Flavobacteriaceae bacterium]|nr:TlpA family protein disulfide reductase [Flavobacteriaceae bacterium]
MRKTAFIVFSLLILNSCSQEPNNYVSIQGKLSNNTDSIISISNRQGVIKKIKLNAAGEFKDTLKLTSEKGEIYNFATSARKAAPIFLKNGFDITLNGNANDFMRSFVFSGKGASNSNFIVAQILKNQTIGDLQQILDLEAPVFEKKITTLKREYDSILNSYNDLDSALYNGIKAQNNQLVTYFKSAYQRNQIMGKGKPSPKFVDYLDINGGKKSLDDFKGKYVYIDIWASWCGPCVVQFPYLKELKKEYKNKNIVFIGISTDEARRSGGSWEAAEKKWRDFIKDKNLGGIQLWSGKDYSFQQAYQASTIPRFILIDPKGNIVDADAPRPSDPALKQLLNSLNL